MSADLPRFSFAYKPQKVQVGRPTTMSCRTHTEYALKKALLSQREEKLFIASIVYISYSSAPNLPSIGSTSTDTISFRLVGIFFPT